MQTGKSAGMKTVEVTWGFRTREELKENHADLIIDHPAEIVELIKGETKKDDSVDCK